MCVQCIVGLRKLDTGDIWVYGARDIPGRRLGYMPQDIALYKHLSIKEMLQVKKSGPFYIKILHSNLYFHLFFSILGGYMG